MFFEILSDISEIETFAQGRGIREIARLRKIYGRGRWRKRKGIARIKLSVARFTSLKYIGTKLPESAAGNSRSNNCFEAHTHSKVRQTTGGMRQEREISDIVGETEDLCFASRPSRGEAQSSPDR
jgi:hypothetical protein